MESIRQLFRLLAFERKDIYNLYVYLVISALVSLSIPLGIQSIINFIAASQISASWYLLIGLVILGTLFLGFLQFMQLWISERIQQNVFAKVAFDISERIHRIYVSTLSKTNLPELMNRFFDTITIQKSLSKVLIDLVGAGVQIILGLALISLYHSFFVIIVIIVLVVLYLAIYFMGPRALQTSIKESSYKYELAYWLQQLAHNIDRVKFVQAENYHLHHTDYFVSGYLKMRQAHFKILVQQFGLVIFLKTIITAVLLVLGGFLVINGEINLGEFVASEIVIVLIIGALEKMILAKDSVYDILTAVTKLSQIGELPLENYSTRTKVNFKEHLDIRLDNISFLGNNNVTLLSAINLDLPYGKKIAFIGINGSGKQKLVNLLSGNYSNFKGALLYNDIPAQNIRTDSFRGIVATLYGSVEEQLFIGTFMDNILLGRSISLEVVVELCKKVNLLSFIQGLEKGFDAPILARGKGYPKHILIKILVVRSLIGVPKVVLIDDLFYDLSKSDRHLIMDILKKGAWTLCIATNLYQTLLYCDDVLVLKDGAITASYKVSDFDSHSYQDLLIDI